MAPGILTSRHTQKLSGNNDICSDLWRTVKQKEKKFNAYPYNIALLKMSKKNISPIFITGKPNAYITNKKHKIKTPNILN